MLPRYCQQNVIGQFCALRVAWSSFTKQGEWFCRSVVQCSASQVDAIQARGGSISSSQILHQQHGDDILPHNFTNHPVESRPDAYLTSSVKSIVAGTVPLQARISRGNLDKR